MHRFYQMWQQLNCSVEHASCDNPSGCNAKLFSWVEVTVGAGTNGAYAAGLANFSTRVFANGRRTTGEGSTALGFYNVQQGDVPYFKSLADNYAMSDNFHQSVNGGTGANHIMLGHGDAIWFSDGNGNSAMLRQTASKSDNGNRQCRQSWTKSKTRIRQPGTNNWYSEDGYGDGGSDSARRVLRRRLLQQLLGSEPAWRERRS